MKVFKRLIALLTIIPVYVFMLLGMFPCFIVHWLLVGKEDFDWWMGIPDRYWKF